MEKDQKSYKILVVEDNPADFFLFQDFLENRILRPHLLRAKNFKEAEAILTETLDLHLIFLDLSLPDRSGEDLISGILALSKDLPVIVLTGYSDISFGVKSLEMGVSDYLLKDELNSTSLYKSIMYNLERKRFLNNLKESEKRYSDLFQLSPQPKWVYNSNTFKFLDVNKAAIDLYGYSYEEFLSMTFQDLFQDQKIGLGIEKNLPLKNLNHRKKNGEVIIVNIHTNPVLYKGIEAKVQVINDVTENHQYIRAIEEQNKKLKTISWNQSHVVRAPLARMMGIIDIIYSDVIDDQEKEELMGHLFSSANEFDEIIREIMVEAEQVKTFSGVQNKNG